MAFALAKGKWLAKGLEITHSGAMVSCFRIFNGLQALGKK
jgi:hypothetical protein